MIGAAVFGEVDKMNSVSSRIMAGRVINGGTGMVELLLDTDMVLNMEHIPDPHQLYSNVVNVKGDDLIDDLF